MFRENSGWEDPKGAQPWEPKPAQQKPQRGEFKKELKAKQALRSQQQQQRRYDESFAPPSKPARNEAHPWATGCVPIRTKGKQKLIAS